MSVFRLALLARKLVCREDLEESGPLFRSAASIEGAMVVSFTHAAGLAAAGGDLSGFEVAGEDGGFVPAIATIVADTVHAWSRLFPILALSATPGRTTHTLVCSIALTSQLHHSRRNRSEII